jgi:hypothetical protein
MESKSCHLKALIVTQKTMEAKTHNMRNGSELCKAFQMVPQSPFQMIKVDNAIVTSSFIGKANFFTIFFSI